jgi:hypothetical protein
VLCMYKNCISPLLFIFIFLASFTLHGQQIIHIENKRLAAIDSGFTGNISIQANFIQNANNIFQNRNYIQIQYTQKKHSILSLSNQNLNIVNRERIVNDGFQHLRYNYRYTNLVTYEAFLQFQYNKVILIDFRTIFGGGPRFTIVQNDSTNMRLFVGTLYMYEYEEETTGVINRDHRISAYISYGKPINEVFLLDVIAYLQPALNRFKDIRTSVEALLEINITKSLRFRLRQSIMFDSRPPEGIRKTFYNFSNGLLYEF